MDGSDDRGVVAGSGGYAHRPGQILDRESAPGGVRDFDPKSPDYFSDDRASGRQRSRAKEQSEAGFPTHKTSPAAGTPKLVTPAIGSAEPINAAGSQKFGKFLESGTESELSRG